jgi:hypothetical protein
MAGSASDYLENAIINSVLRGATFPTPSNVFLSLHTADPTDANDDSTEVLADWYVRQDTSKDGELSAAWTAPANGVSRNALSIQFPPVTGATVTVTHVGLYDAPTGGNLLYHSALAPAKTLEADDVLTVATNAFTIVTT